MDADSAKTTVKVIAVLHYVSAGLSILFALLFLFLVPLVINDEGFGDLAAIVSGMLAIILFINAVVDAVIGYGLWNARNWGRIFLLVVYWALAVLGLLFALLSAGAGEWAGALFNLMVWSGTSAILIWLFQFQPAVVAVFTGQPGLAVKKE